MTRCARAGLVLALLAGLVGLTGGCGGLDLFGWLFKPKADPIPERADARDQLLSDTIGQRTVVAGGDDLVVRGFSIVIGLGESGGGGCPAALREYLVETLQKELAADEKAALRKGRPRFSLNDVIDSPDSAVVEVLGRIPPGAPKGTVFDVQVQCVSGTQTRSIEGGMLIPTELRELAPDASGKGMLAGAALARARGPVFTNPFVGEREREPGGASGGARTGFVLGGGYTIVDRSMRLLLSDPSYPLARRIEGRVNERFGPRTAEAQSKAEVKLTTPSAYAGRPLRFRELAAHQYLQGESGFIERKLRDLAGQLDKQGVDLEHVSLIWEAIGRGVVAQLQPLYSSPDAAVRFYAARAGLRLRDNTAVPVLAGFLTGDDGTFRVQAARELGDSQLVQAGARLTPLLDSEDFEARIAAYEALRTMHHPAIQSRQFTHAIDPTQVNLVLETVASNGKPMIYVRRSREPRIAIFGPPQGVTAPMFYAHAGDRVILNAATPTDDIHIAYKLPSGRAAGSALTCPPKLMELIVALASPPQKPDMGQVRGAGLNYAQVVQVLATLCREGTIPVRIELERVSMTDLMGPRSSPRRPEADEPDAAPPPAERAPAKAAPARPAAERKPARPESEEPPQ